MKISALDEDGESVDWWFAYKVPKLAANAANLSATGYEYLYFDTKSPGLALSPNLLTSGKGALDLTVASILGQPDATTGWILYNDEMPSSAKRRDKSSFGHTKGLLAFDVSTKTALWLLHSWPKYADPAAIKNPAEMPTPIYGQTFLCLSLDLGTASAIAAQMGDHQEPQVYLPRIPQALSEDDPLALLAQPLKPNPPAEHDAIQCTTSGGMAFRVIAKNREWGGDFWNGLVGPVLEADMDVETWIRGKIPPTLDTDGIHKTFDVKYIDFSPLGAPYAWPETHDHAKWGLSEAGDWICVGDINRMVSQERRGGGTIAFQNPKLWAALQKADLLVAPPGHSRVDALRLIEETHPPTATPAPKRGKKSVAQPAANRKRP